jgi:hypothetical protein
MEKFNSHQLVISHNTYFLVDRALNFASEVTISDTHSEHTGERVFKRIRRASPNAANGTKGSFPNTTHLICDWHLSARGCGCSTMSTHGQKEHEHFSPDTDSDKLSVSFVTKFHSSIQLSSLGEDQSHFLDRAT